MRCYVLDLQEIDRTQLAVVGGKGAHLGELARIDGVRVPPAFCVTTAAFVRIMAEAPSLDQQIARLADLWPDDREAIRVLSGEVRQAIESVAMPDDVAAEIADRLARVGGQEAYAVRSSATAEDLPTASFAGQQDTYLNVVGPRAILQHVSRCWASLFTERAVTYRLRNGIDHRTARMAVVVQRMVFPQAAGILFTADPITGNRKVASIEASFGLGEALVSGLVNADVYKVRDGEIVARTVAAKRLEIGAAPGGGTIRQEVAPARQQQPALTDEQIVQLAQLGRRIEAQFGRPQDIEWCLDDGSFQIVQSRPVTTLFPIPEAEDGEYHVYISVGHQQMMTDPILQLGLSMWQLTALRPMLTAGGRLFVDVTAELSSPAGQSGLLELVGRSDPLLGDALRTVIARDDRLRALPDDGAGVAPAAGPAAGGTPAPIANDPAIVAGLVGRMHDSLAALKDAIRSKSGPALFDFILADLQELKRLLFDPQSHQAIVASVEATWWLNDHLRVWLGEKDAAHTLSQSVPDNVTSEMGLALLDVADVVRTSPAVVAFLEQIQDDGFLDDLSRLPSGQAAAIRGFLDRYGMRCVGEIDITRPRWSERPSALIPMILSNVRNFGPGEGMRRFERGRQEAAEKAHELVERVRALPDGAERAAETQRMIDRLRTFAGYREFPKYGMVCRYAVYKQALMAEADRLVAVGVLRTREDAFFLTVQELHDGARTQQVDPGLIRQRKDEFRTYQSLTPPRVLTSDGEALTGAYHRDDLPAGALAGLPVSAGMVEGRARVILDMAGADLEPGDILVTAFTDPSWTPLFVAIGGLVTEVGGLMTHGAVIAREYGLPAVVGVEQATSLIRDGQRIRVHGTEGYVEILS
ncbi:MAG: phosphoenolpyruvate synthase [Chloroflexi bacterium]|nr:phosphoenolpyruvate synthase [Chloroflexota bacterium]